LIKLDHIDTARLVIARPRGILDTRMAEELVEFIEIKEVESEKAFNRFIDFTHVEGVQLSSADIFPVGRSAQYIQSQRYSRKDGDSGGYSAHLWNRTDVRAAAEFAAY
jgi:hypothetical protein